MSKNAACLNIERGYSRHLNYNKLYFPIIDVRWKTLSIQSNDSGWYLKRLIVVEMNVQRLNDVHRPARKLPFHIDIFGE